jgi:hypothetical protein
LISEIGEFELDIIDTWGQGIPIMDGMQGVVGANVSVMAVFGLLKDLLEELV